MENQSSTIYSKDKQPLAQVIDLSNGFEDGISFFTLSSRDIQFASMKYVAGKKIASHVHSPRQRVINTTSEVLIVLKGELKAFIYDQDKSFVSSLLISSGQILILYGGGHGFEVQEDIEMYEIKQGPYLNDLDKERFES